MMYASDYLLCSTYSSSTARPDARSQTSASREVLQIKNRNHPKSGERNKNIPKEKEISVAFPDQMDTEGDPPTKMTTSAFSANAIIIKQNTRELESSGYW